MDGMDGMDDMDSMDGMDSIDGGMQAGSNGATPLSQDAFVKTSPISIKQLRHLVQLLDRSDVSEIELRREQDGTRLILRKAKVPESSQQQLEEEALQMQLVEAASSASRTPPVENKYHVNAPLVGIFHPWAKPKGGSLVAVGDHVKVGQLVATIESLNVINEVEAAVAGRVIEIVAQEGQPVEYGQHLITIDSSEEA